jgi:Zn-dependent metalloprotease
MIWSQALWDIRTSLGHVRADTLILQAQFSFTPAVTMPEAASLTVAAAQSLYGNGAANAARAAFQARGILP